MPDHRRQRCTATLTLLTALLIATLARAQTNPDVSSPTATLTTIARALEAGDKQTVRAAVTADEKQLPVIDATVDVAAATHRLQTAVKERFAAVAESDGRWATRFARLDAAEVKVEGESATVSIPKPLPPSWPPEHRPPPEQLKLTKVGDVWKLDAAELLGNRAPAADDVDAARQLAKVLDETAAEVRDGRHKTYAEVMTAHGQRLVELLRQGDVAGSKQGGTTTQPAPPAGP